MYIPVSARNCHETRYNANLGWQTVNQGGLVNLDWQEPAVLTKDRRLRMNALVDKVNGKIAEAVQAAGNKVVFVDYDRYFGDLQGRFCAPGTEEPNPQK
jgi:hypothetical protein